MCAGYAAQLKALRDQLSAERPQLIHASSNMLVGSANHIQTALRHDSFPSEGTSLLLNFSIRYQLCQHLVFLTVMHLIFLYMLRLEDILTYSYFLYLYIFVPRGVAKKVDP